MTLKFAELVNLSAYTLDETALNRFHKEFLTSGALVLPNFIDDKILEVLIKEASEQEEKAFHNRLVGTAYLQPPDESFPKDHPKRKEYTTALAVVAYDMIPEKSALRCLYHSDEFQNLLKKVTGFDDIYEYNCPLGKINISVMGEGDHLRWHFDQSEFVVSLVLRDAEEGGEFEYVSNLRDKANPNYSEVKAVLEGEHSKVKSLRMPPGSLVLFRGMNTLHRVTPVSGKNSRLVALLGYVLNPEATSTEHLRLIRYGRTE